MLCDSNLAFIAVVAADAVVVVTGMDISLFSTEYMSVYKKRQARSMYTKSDRNYVTQPYSLDKSVTAVVVFFIYITLLLVPLQ